MVEQRSKVRRYSGFVMGGPASMRAMGGEEGVEARRDARRQPAVPPISSEYSDHLEGIYMSWELDLPPTIIKSYSCVTAIFNISLKQNYKTQIKPLQRASPNLYNPLPPYSLSLNITHILRVTATFPRSLRV